MGKSELSARSRATTRWLCILGFLDLASVSMVVPLMSQRTSSLGANPLMQGIIGSIYGGVQLLSAPTIGCWSDALGRKPILVTCMMATACGYCILSLPSLVFTVAARVICGVFKQSQSISQALIADLVPASESAVHFGHFNALSSVGFIVGPTLGGHMSDLEDGFFWICLVSASIFFTSAGLVWRVLPAVTADPRRNVKESGFVDRLRELNVSSCWDLLLMRFSLSFAALVYRSSFHYSVAEGHGLRPKHLGYLMSFQGLVSAVAGFLVGPVGKLLGDGPRRLVLESLVLAVSLTGVTFSSSVPLLMVSLTAMNLTTAFLRVSVTKACVSWSPPDKMGAMMGLSQSITSVGRMLSPLVAGAALQFHLYGAGAVSIAFALLGFLVCCYTATKRPNPNAKLKTV